MSALCDTTTWLPHRAWPTANGAIEDREYRDFDAQSERLTTHDQEYLQLSDGPFRGRFVSCLLGSDVSLHIEHANQSLSQTVAGAAHAYAIGVVLSDGYAFRANGASVDCDSVFVVPPGADLHLYSPHHGTIMACVIASQLFEARLAAHPRLHDRLHDLRHDVACFHVPTVADRLRRDAHSAMFNNAQVSPNLINNAVLGETLVDGLLTTLALALHADPERLKTRRPASFDHFLAVKARLDVRDPVAQILPALAQDLALSKRTLQYTFAQEVSLGLSGYQRRLRLHAVRKVLCTEPLRTQNIGDIAARHGFWNWSHFSQQYRQLFGERPSDTASRQRGHNG